MSKRLPAVGRPRAAGPSTSGLTTEEDILVAAARLFCEVGYGSTSTYAIAREAGIAQASVYHYFNGKHAILLELLLRTVHPSVEFAAALLVQDGPAVARLRALCEYDVHLLVATSENIGALYLLPELGDERFAPFHAERNRLYDVYRQLIGECPGVDPTGADELARLVFGLVESVILRRRAEPGLGVLGSAGPGFAHHTIATSVADAALRIIGAPGI